MKISVIIVSFNTRAILKKCLEALYQNPGSSDLEVFVVDNNSSDESAAMVKQHFEQVILIENPINSGFAPANNMAYAQATGDYIILLNPDAYVKPGTVSNSVRFMENHPECGICGARLIKPDGSLDPSARRFPNSLYKLLTISGLSDKHPSSKIFGRGDFKYFDHNSVMEVDWVPGTFTIYRREMVSQIGFLDNRFYLYYEETDLCLRAERAGWKTFFNPAAEVIHIGGASSKTRKDLKFDKGGAQVLKFRIRSECLYFRKNYGLFSMLANSGVEIGWHCLRFLVNLRPGEHRLYKRQESTELIKHGFRAIRDTYWGKTAPEIPW